MLVDQDDMPDCSKSLKKSLKEVETFQAHVYHFTTFLFVNMEIFHSVPLGEDNETL